MKTIAGAVWGYALYAESFKGRDHLRRIQEEAHAILLARGFSGG
ncbi:MAG: hypothetical protein M5R38_16395 [Candidatus Methylomirabilis sp.]|nr:hypothetical protein [Candidatus Methylomirabilis sp.]